MNNPSPLIPQGVTPSRGKTSLCVKVLMIVMVHVVVIGGMLLAGCERTKDQAKQDNSTPGSDTTALAGATSNAPTADVPPTLNPNIGTNFAGTTVSAAPAPQSPLAVSAVPPAKPADLTPAPSAADGKEYVIAKGDTLGAIAHKSGISLKALTDANPGLNAKKLKIGQKIQIPGGTAEVAATTPGGAAPAAAVDGGTAESAVYVVKSGDMLLRIAKNHGTTVKKIMAMNDLKTTSIRPGQKLKVPAAKVSEPVAAPAAASAALTQPAPAAFRVSATAPTPSSVASN